MGGAAGREAAPEVPPFPPDLFSVPALEGAAIGAHKCGRKKAAMEETHAS